MKNPIKAKLKDGKVVLGPWISLKYNPEIPLRLSTLGFDFLLYDMEHAQLDRETVAQMIKVQSRYQGAKGYQKNCVPLVRIPWNTIWLVKHMLDTGAYGLVIPLVNTREEAINAVQYCKYPPMGIRGCAPGYAAFQDPEYIETANDETLVVVQIESQVAINNLEDIVSVEGIDVAFIGPLDLAMSYGWYNKPDRWNNTRKAMTNVIETCDKHGVATGMALGGSQVEEGIQMGIRLVATGSPLGWMIDGANGFIERIKKTKWQPSS